MWKWDHRLKPRNQFRKWSKPWKNHFESYGGTCKHTLLRAPRSQQRKVLMYIFVLCFITFFSLKCFVWRPIRKGSAVPKEGKGCRFEPFMESFQQLRFPFTFNLFTWRKYFRNESLPLPQNQFSFSKGNFVRYCTSCTSQYRMNKNVVSGKAKRLS